VSDDERSLYERVGGKEAIAELVDDFYTRLLGDKDLVEFFNMARMDHLRAMQREFFSIALDGPITYTGGPLRHVHQGRGIRREHFSKFAQHMLDTLVAYGVSEDEVSEIIGRINTYADEIVGGHGTDG
jgi:hemoglobin